MVTPKDRKPGRLIARGATAEIYDWAPGLILKLFNEGFGRGAVEYEAQIARAVFASGLPVPAAGEVVQVKGRYGLVYQRVEGRTMSEMFLRRPWRLGDFARRMAELHAEMHSGPFQAVLPTQRERLKDKLIHASALPDRLRGKAFAALEKLPDGDQLCHGDFHPKNILINKQGEIIIDWVDATLGSPLADVARTVIILQGAAESRQTKSAFEKAFIRKLLAIYLQRYFQLRPGGEEVYSSLLPVIAAARLSENHLETRKWLLGVAEKIQ